MMYSDGRVSDVQPEDLNKLTLSKVRRAVEAQMRPQDMEINLVADFDGCGYQKASSAVDGVLSTGKHHDGGVAKSEDELEVLAGIREQRLLELDEALWRYLGSLPPSKHKRPTHDQPPCITNGKALPQQDRTRTAHLEDSD